MFIGIDVGGTFTDAVLLDRGHVRAHAKVSTQEDLLLSLLEALDKIMKGVSGDLVERVVLSTTMITNLIVEKKYDPVGLVIVPGPGLSHHHFRKFNTSTQIISGAIDYRGREIIPLKQEEIEQAILKLAAQGYKKAGVIGKFSSRNNCHEMEIDSWIKRHHPDWRVELGHQVAGQLNFPRRVVSTMLTCATRNKYELFVDMVMAALSKRRIKAPVFILKADAGTLPLLSSIRAPMETIFSGPAASTLGVQALTLPGETSVVVDIGGTTTDLALILRGQPLLASKGAIIDDFYTHVRALAVKSVPVGGDSIVERVGKEIIIYSERLGPPYCQGGPLPTPTDALRVLGLTRLGDRDRALKAMESLGRPLGISVEEAANMVCNLVIDAIAEEVQLMFKQWEQEPAYRVWEVLEKTKERPGTVVGVGGGAAGFITQIATKLGAYPVIPPYAPVANAIGAAVALPTLGVTLRVDTEQGYFSIEEEGYQGTINDSNFTGEQALDLASHWLEKRVLEHGLTQENKQVEIIRREVFNMVRNWVTTGKIYDVHVQTPRGILGHIGVGGELTK